MFGFWGGRIFSVSFLWLFFLSLLPLGCFIHHSRALCSDGLGWKMCTRIRVCAISGGLRFTVLARRNGCRIMTAGDYFEVGFLVDFFDVTFT